MYFYSARHSGVFLSGCRHRRRIRFLSPSVFTWESILDRSFCRVWRKPLDKLDPCTGSFHQRRSTATTVLSGFLRCWFARVNTSRERVSCKEHLWYKVMAKISLQFLPVRIEHLFQYSRVSLERPPHWPQKCGRVSVKTGLCMHGDRFSYIKNVGPKCQQCVVCQDWWSLKTGGLSRLVVSHGRGLSRQVSLHRGSGSWIIVLSPLVKVTNR